MRGITGRTEAAQTNEVLGLIAKATPRQDKIKLDAPEIAESGNTVPIAVRVETPMTQTDYAKAIHLVAEHNPQPLLATFLLTPKSGKADVQLRVRLAQTQDVTVLVQMNDGSLWSASRQVKVTIGGCGGG